MKSTSTIFVHGGATIAFAKHHPQNANSVCLVITDNAGGTYEMTVFDLPRDEVDKLYNGFGKPLRVVTDVVTDDEHEASTREDAA